VGVLRGCEWVNGDEGLQDGGEGIIRSFSRDGNVVMLTGRLAQINKWLSFSDRKYVSHGNVVL
jgi:hypothetical protein